jgi:hypothetical protein
VVFVYAFRAILIRRHPAIFLAFVAGLAGLAAGSSGCANRGMHAPGDGGTAGAAGRGGATGTGGRGGSGGSPTGTAGRGGGTGGQTTGTGGCTIAPGPAATGGACGAMFDFESSTEGAVINSGSTAFTAVARSTAISYCGTGALAISSLFSGTSGTTTKGEVLIPLPGAPVDLTNKMITVHVAADPGCSSDLALSLVVNTQSGPIYFTPPFPIRPVTNSWKTMTVTVSADAGTTTGLNLSLQAFSSTGYTGTIYVDEIDVR